MHVDHDTNLLIYMLLIWAHSKAPSSGMQVAVVQMHDDMACFGTHDTHKGKGQRKRTH